MWATARYLESRWMKKWLAGILVILDFHLAEKLTRCCQDEIQWLQSYPEYKSIKPYHFKFQVPVSLILPPMFLLVTVFHLWFLQELFRSQVFIDDKLHQSCKILFLDIHEMVCVDVLAIIFMLSNRNMQIGNDWMGGLYCLNFSRVEWHYCGTAHIKSTNMLQFGLFVAIYTWCPLAWCNAAIKCAICLVNTHLV